MEAGIYTYERHIWLNDLALTLDPMVDRLKEMNITIHNIEEMDNNGHSYQIEMQ